MSFRKAGKSISTGSEISVKENPIWRSYQVIEIPQSRVGAKLVSNFILETTNPHYIKQLDQNQLINRHNKFMGIKGTP